MVRSFVGIASVLLIEGAVGAFWALVAIRFWAADLVGWPRADAWALPALFGVLGSALLGLILSLVRPRRPFGRAILFTILFLLLACATVGIKFSPPRAQVFAGAADGVVILFGLLVIRSLSESFQTGARPPWSRWITGMVTLAPALLLGVLSTGVGLAFGPAPPDLRGEALGYLALAALGFLLMETLLAFIWLKGLTEGPPEAQAAAGRVLDARRGLTVARLTLAGLAALACATAAFSELAAPAGICAAFGCALASEANGRFLLEKACEKKETAS